ncbi:MAG: efflux RND transporter permease subunit [Proteobacteria bacterium]|nr:efflux RND transporter permease subunit [Pseudomonadota bacterium]
MISRLIAFALTQRLIIALAAVGLIVAGTLALLRLPIDAFPDISTTQTKIILKAPGMTPEEVEARIVVPIEQELLGIPNQTILRSMAKYGIADITIDFSDSTEIYWARQQVSERLAAVMADLPDSVSGGLAPIATPLSDVFMFTLEGPLPLAERRALIDWVIRPRLRTLEGVADVNALGGFVRTFEVEPDMTALVARELSLKDLRAALQANNRGDGAGRVTAGEESLPIRVDSTVKTLEDIGAIAVKTDRAGVVRVADVATVQYGTLTRYGAVTRNGVDEATQGIVIALRGANARTVVARVRAELDAIAKTLPEGIEIVPFYDRSALVDRATGTVAKALLEAAVLIVILLVLFLGDLRAAIVVTMALPLAALATFLVMEQVGLSANLMSLGGLAVAIGMLVDAAVVVVENVVARLGEPARERPAPVLHVIFRAVKEVAAPVIGGIMIIAVVFLPLLTLQGLEGKLFRPVASTIVIALVASLILSLTVIPVLSSFMLRRAEHQEPWLMRKLTPAFMRLFDWSMQHTKVVLAIAAATVVAALIAFPFLGKSFIPTLDEGDVLVQIAKLPSISLEDSARIDLDVQQEILRTTPEVKNIMARLGSDELGLDPMSLNDTDTFLELKPETEWRGGKDEIIASLRQVGASFPGLAFGFTQPIEMRVSEMLTGTRGDVAVKIFGPEIDELNRLALAVQAELQRIDGAEDVMYLANDSMQYLRVDLDRTVLGAAAGDAENVQQELRALVEGERIGSVLTGGRRVPLVIRGSEDYRGNIESIGAAPVGGAAGAGTPLTATAGISVTQGPVKLERENSSRFSVVSANVEGRDLVGFVEEASAAVAQAVPLPVGYRLTWGGEFQNQQRAAARLTLVVPIALGFVFLLLFATLGSLRQAALVLANIPFALVGGIAALAVSGEYLSVPASIGFIALMGIAVLNGLVLVGYFNQLLARGVSLVETVRGGVLRRLRPVLMTASITAFGLVPLLFATGPGSEVQRPLAVVVIGGLMTSTALTLVVLPILFKRFGVAR